MYSVGNIVNDFIISLMTDGNWTYCGDHFERYKKYQITSSIKGTYIVL